MLNDFPEKPCKAHGRIGCLQCRFGPDGYAPPKRGNVQETRDSYQGEVGWWDEPRPAVRPGDEGRQASLSADRNPVRGRPGSPLPRSAHHLDDTAPFDVEVLNHFLNAGYPPHAAEAGAAYYYGGDKDHIAADDWPRYGDEYDN